MYVNLSLSLVALVPPAVVTVTSTAPADPAGEVAVISVALTGVKLAAVVSNLTAVGLLRWVPVIVTDVPPPVGPDDGLTAVTVGPATYVKLSAALVALVPPAVVTVTSTAPADPAGEVAVIEVALTGVNELAAVVPNLTAVGLLRWVPVIVTVVPPPVGPADGLTPVTLGQGLSADSPCPWATPVSAINEIEAHTHNESTNARTRPIPRARPAQKPIASLSIIPPDRRRSGAIVPRMAPSALRY
jgi:hypothetical protein